MTYAAMAQSQMFRESRSQLGFGRLKQTWYMILKLGNLPAEVIVKIGLWLPVAGGVHFTCQKSSGQLSHFLPGTPIHSTYRSRLLAEQRTKLNFVNRLFVVTLTLHSKNPIMGYLWGPHHFAFCQSCKVVLFWPEIAYPVLAGYQWDDGEERVLVNNKCKCVTVTSKFVPSKDNPEEEVLERNIRIM